jgi:hypothetical protein
MKKLMMKKLEGGDQKGHHGVFDGDDMLGYVHADDFADHAKKHLDDLMDYDDFRAAASKHPGIKGEEAEEGEEMKGDGKKKMRERLAEFEAREARAQAQQIILSELVEDGHVDNSRAALFAQQGRLTLADYIAAQEAEKEIDEAVRAGKLLPRDRKFFFCDALERPAEFAEYVKGAVPVVNLSSVGIDSGEGMSVDQELDARVKELRAKDDKLDYGQAMQKVLASDAQLKQRYNELHRRELGAGA